MHDDIMIQSEPENLSWERHKVIETIHNWGTWRDGNRWQLLRTLYTENATMAVSWFEGTANDFIEGCISMSERLPNPVKSQHLIGNSSTTFLNKKCVAETRMSIFLRLQVHGVECDITAIGSFYDYLRKVENAWLIERRVAIFDKDMMQPVFPGDNLKVDKRKFETFPEPYRCCAYTFAERGMVINSDLPIAGGRSLSCLYNAGNIWLMND